MIPFSSRFMGPLVVEVVPAVTGGKIYRLVEPLDYMTDVLPHKVITIPAGFESDGARHAVGDVAGHTRGLCGGPGGFARPALATAGNGMGGAGVWAEVGTNPVSYPRERIFSRRHGGTERKENHGWTRMDTDFLRQDHRINRNPTFLRGSVSL